MSTATQTQRPALPAFYPVVPETGDLACPLCGRPLIPGKARLLYGELACKRCRFRFSDRRAIALLLDYIVLYPVLVALAAFGLGTSALLSSFFLSGSSWPLWVAAGAVVAMKEGFGGGSPGKLIMGLRVVRADTREPIGFLESFKRNILLTFPLVRELILADGYLRGTRLGDGWAGTMVIRRKLAHRVPFGKPGRICRSCGYSLRERDRETCPECGTRPALERPLTRGKRAELFPAELMDEE